ncbi:MAG: DUF2802 domain-containing protein [Chromatiales bacterium]|jgi:DNA polymerase/3'-5' exonuclease PolX
MNELSLHLPYVALSGAVLIAAACGLLALALWHQLRQLRGRCAELDTQLKDLRSQLVAEIANAAGSGRRQLAVERDIDQLRHRQDQLELRMADAQSYGQAEQLVKRGAGMEELISSCGLSRGEAELVMRMHRFREAG